VEELYAKTISAKFSCTEKQRGISPRLVGIVTVRSTYNVALNSLRVEAQEQPWNNTGGMTPWVASTASSGAFKSGT